jgi:OOP family OmpA-OmpF porin
MKKFNKIAMALAAGLMAGVAMADAPQLYVGVGAGQSEFQEFCDAYSSCDDNDTSWKVLGGAQFNEYLAVEFQYQDLGEASGRDGGAREGIEAHAFGIHILPQIPLTQDLSAFLRLGFVRAGVDNTGALDGTDYETTTSYGLGLQYNVTSNIAIRAEYDFIHNVGDDDEDRGEEDIEYLGLSAIYKF